MSRPTKDPLHAIMGAFGMKADDVKEIPPVEPMPNGITDAEIEQLGKSGTDAMRDRLKLAALGVNLQLLACGIDAPWRRLLDDFNDDIECTTRLQPVMIDGQPLTWPDGTVQKVCVDRGTFPGDPAMRDALWKLHDVLEEIESYQEKHKARSSKGGAKTKYESAAIVGVIRSIETDMTRKLSEKEIRRELNERIGSENVPKRDTLYSLIKSARSTAQ